MAVAQKPKFIVIRLRPAARVLPRRQLGVAFQRVVRRHGDPNRIRLRMAVLSMAGTGVPVPALAVPVLAAKPLVVPLLAGKLLAVQGLVGKPRVV